MHKLIEKLNVREGLPKEKKLKQIKIVRPLVVCA
jgi:hypothetical protein